MSKKDDVGANGSKKTPVRSRQLQRDDPLLHSRHAGSSHTDAGRAPQGASVPQSRTSSRVLSTQKHDKESPAPVHRVRAASSNALEPRVGSAGRPARLPLRDEVLQQPKRPLAAREEHALQLRGAGEHQRAPLVRDTPGDPTAAGSRRRARSPDDTRLVLRDGDIVPIFRHRPTVPVVANPAQRSGAAGDQPQVVATAPGGQSDTKYDPSGSAVAAAVAARRSGHTTTRGAIRYRTNNKLVKCCKWIFTAYDLVWARRGLPWRTATLPEPISYICGKPEYNTTVLPDGQRRQHFQGVVVFKNMLSWDEVVKQLGMTPVPWVYPVGNENLTKSIEYTKKDESAVLEDGDTMWREAGEIPPNQFRAGEKNKVIMDMVKEGATMEEVIDYDPSAMYRITQLERVRALYTKPQHRDDIQCYLVTGPTRIGKSYAIMRMLEPDIYNKPHPRSIQQTDFFLGYEGEEAIIFDDFHPSRYPLLDLLNYLQGYKMRVGVKYGDRPAGWKRVYLTSNVPIEEWYKKEQRDPLYQENYHALCARIPMANRLNFHTPIPRGTMVQSWEELVATQAAPVPIPAEVPSRIPGLVDMFEHMIALGTDKMYKKLMDKLQLSEEEREELQHALFK